MDNKKIIQLLSKLNRETKENKIVWQISRLISAQGNEVVVDNIYQAEVGNKILRLYKYKEKYYIDEDRYEWTKGLRLEFVDVNWKSEYAFPELIILNDLYETVRFKTSGVEDFFDSYVGDEIEPDSDPDF